MTVLSPHSKIKLLAAESFAPWQDHVIKSKRRAAKSPFGPLRLYPSASSEQTVQSHYLQGTFVSFSAFFFCRALEKILFSRHPFNCPLGRSSPW